MTHNSPNPPESRSRYVTSLSRYSAPPNPRFADVRVSIQKDAETLTRLDPGIAPVGVSAQNSTKLLQGPVSKGPFGSLRRNRVETRTAISLAPSHAGLVSADAFISFRVPSETRARLQSLAATQGITESAFLRQTLSLALGGSGPIDGPAPPAAEPVGLQNRMSVRLSSEDRRKVKERATARGVASATYAALVLRAHLSGNAPIPKAEYQLLRQSVHELTAIGRNLNQIARSLNLGGRTTVPGRTEVFGMLKVAEALRDHFKELLKANAASWSHHAQAPH